MTGIAANIGSVQRFQRAMSLSRRLGASVFDGAAAAYSLRIPAGSTYSGPLIRVRRSSDNAESDFGAALTADANGNRWLDEQALTLFCGAPKYPVDAVSGAAAAFSMRLLRQSYSGPAIRVRRSSDNAELDIGFVASELNAAALLAFVGSGSGFVTTWYDQTGNGRHKTQPTVASQPRIVNAGVIELLGGRYALRFLGEGYRLRSATSYTAKSAISVLRHDVFVPLAGVFGLLPDLGIRLNDATMAYRSVNGGDFSFNAYLRLNGVQTAAPSNTSAVTIGAAHMIAANSQIFHSGPFGAGGYFNGRYMNGAISELIEFPNDVSGNDWVLLEQSQATYYGIAYARTIPNGFVTTWYDQTGNGRNATQATAGLQPSIVNAGSVSVQNGRPIVVYGTDKRLIATTGLAGLSLTINAVATPGAASGSTLDNRCITVGTHNGPTFVPAGIAMKIDTGLLRSTTFTILDFPSTPAPAGTAFVASTTLSSSQVFFEYKNGAQFATGSSNIVVGNSNGTVGDALVSIQEAMFFRYVLNTGSRLSLERSQGAAFGITVA